ncbi:MAG: S24/S26 family peptidase [Pseudomonadota bacterium]
MDRNAPDSHLAIKRFDSIALSGKALGILVKAFVETGSAIQFSARGESMFPFIKDGDIILISPYGDVPPRPGDMVAFIDAGTEKLIVHRLIRVSPEGFTAKGDNCYHLDAPQPRNNILGYVSRINNRNDFLWGIQYIKIRKIVTFFSLFGLTAILGRMLRKIDKLTSPREGYRLF